MKRLFPRVSAKTEWIGQLGWYVVALKNERRRQNSVAHTLYVQELRKHSGTAFGEFFKVVQEMEWTIWLSDNRRHAGQARQ